MTVETIGDDTIGLELRDATQFPLIPEMVRNMLKEIYEWLNSRYEFNAYITLQRNRLGIIISKDITKDIYFCIEACIRREQENRLGAYSTGQACAEDCYMDFKRNADFDFRIVLTEVKKIIDKYAYEHKISDKWDFTTKVLTFIVRF
jgi:hypothetical protein